MAKRQQSLLKRIALTAEKKAITDAIAQYGSRVMAAASLGITTQTLRQKLAQK